MVLEKTLESPLYSRRSHQSIIKEISPECSLEGLMLNLKLQYFGHLMWRADSFEKTLMLGKIEGRPGSTVPEILQARTLEWSAIAFSPYLTVHKIDS